MITRCFARDQDFNQFRADMEIVGEAEPIEAIALAAERTRRC